MLPSRHKLFWVRSGNALFYSYVLTLPGPPGCILVMRKKTYPGGLIGTFWVRSEDVFFSFVIFNLAEHTRNVFRMHPDYALGTFYRAFYRAFGEHFEFEMCMSYVFYCQRRAIFARKILYGFNEGRPRDCQNLQANR